MNNRSSYVIFGPADAREDFAGEANANGFTTQNRPLHQFAAGPQNATEVLQVLFSKEGLAFFTALAGLVMAFLKKSPSRRITITKIENDRALAIDARGLTKKELANLLSESREMIIYDKKDVESPFAKQFEKLLRERWQKKSLEDFRRESERELNGTLFESIRAENAEQGSRRLLLVVCTTGEHQISLVEKALDLEPDFFDEPPQSWETQSMFDLASDTEAGLGLSYQEQCNASGKRTAIILCATRPEKIAMLEKLFNLPHLDENQPKQPPAC